MKKIVLIVVILLVAAGGAAAAWHLGIGPFAPVEVGVEEEEVAVEDVLVPEEVVDYDAIDASENEPSSAPKIKKMTESFKKKEYQAYDFDDPHDRFKARKQVEIEMAEQKETVSRDMRLSSPEYQEKRLRYDAMTNWLGEDGRNLVPTPTPTPGKEK